VCFCVKARIFHDLIEIEFILHVKTKSYFEERSIGRKKFVFAILNHKEPLRR